MSALLLAALHALRPRTVLAAALACGLVAPACAQEAAPAEPAPAEAPPPKPKPRPKPKPKAAKPAPAPDAAQSAEAPSDATKPDPSHLQLRTGDTAPAAEATKAKPKAAERPMLPAANSAPPAAKPSDTAQIAPERAAFSGPAVACDPGKSVLYDGPKDISLWVTRTGSVTVTNPLRPLTPDITRVLQIVIGGKLATAYGADLNAVRRGGSPSMLEAQLGGPIRWDAALGTLPDALDIVADSGATVAEMRFKECGDAPAAKVAPVAKAKTEKKQARKPADPASAPSPAPASMGAQAGAGSAPAPGNGARPGQPPRRQLPQGAIAE